MLLYFLHLLLLVYIAIALCILTHTYLYASTLMHCTVLFTSGLLTFVTYMVLPQSLMESCSQIDW